MATKFTLEGFLRLAFAKQDQFFAAARAKRETSALRARLPKSFNKQPSKRITVSPRLEPFYTEYNRYGGPHSSSVMVYCYAISLDVDCVDGEEKTLELALEFWKIGMANMTSTAEAVSYELNLRYDGIEATAFAGCHGDCREDIHKIVSESLKIQEILRAFMEDCGVEVQGEPQRPKKKRKVEAAKEPPTGSKKVDVDALPDVVDAQCMELLTAILGPSGKKVLDVDSSLFRWWSWTLMKIIQKGHCGSSGWMRSTTSFLRRTPAAEEHEIDFPYPDDEDEE
ncbi:hypothetical protein CYLTODRAFT_457358 [Cylindrobasidium torrendii FP15055 ss-10]|uniref:Uncharacterized protein n=1 Tax=Cylindrobasidium torrendii FP15055 ss-10 TaxID=1314674 RepID=A0A0D7B422_9AGAR|nr:hypothetical protein CYLTODRAFT_457358 [Cylindrobasidium torrendii FP15055 ss-10]